jgi:hypothetical protein
MSLGEVPYMLCYKLNFKTILCAIFNSASSAAPLECCGSVNISFGSGIRNPWVTDTDPGGQFIIAPDPDPTWSRCGH